MYIDFDEYTDSRITRHSPYVAYQLSAILGPRRQFGTPQQLRSHVEDYFSSRVGVKLSRAGVPIIDPMTGRPVLTVVRPYTLSGLARHLGVTTAALKQYRFNSIRRGIPDEFLPILDDARQRIEEFMEEKLYDGEGSRGAQFGLGAAFGWESPKERVERQTTKIRTAMAREEHRLKMEQMARGDADSGFTITVVRAGQNLANDDNIIQLDGEVT